MIFEVNGNKVRIKGSSFPERHIQVSVTEYPGEDRYSINIMDDGIERGGLCRI